ncbi:uncharacterized protein M421DRAFT_51306, partial [Didymella exigua CBS 183.55]
YILNLNLRGFAPQLCEVADMADKLLAFKLVEETKAKYSVYNNNVHNFNKTSF